MSSLRIISGQFRGRRLDGPEGQEVRPTSDRLRERIFSIVLSRKNAIGGLRVADLFAGTGAMGIEAISRGAGQVWFVEKHQRSLDLLSRNLAKIGATDLAHVISADALSLPSVGQPFDLLFLDPPYGRDLAEPALKSLLDQGWIAANSLIILELAADDSFNPPDDFQIIDERKQGKSRVIFMIPSTGNELSSTK